MTEVDRAEQADRRPRKYLWFGYGNYGTQPNLQIPAGNIRDPGISGEISRESKPERSPVAFFACTAAAIGLILLVMLLAWVVTLLMR